MTLLAVVLKNRQDILIKRGCKNKGQDHVLLNQTLLNWYSFRGFTTSICFNNSGSLFATGQIQKFAMSPSFGILFGGFPRPFRITVFMFGLGRSVPLMTFPGNCCINACANGNATSQSSSRAERV